MFDSYRQLCRLLLPILLCWPTVQAVVFPATVEVHLVFPRNDTFAPSALTPIVFAIYNSQLAAPLDLNFDWDIYQPANPHGPTFTGGIDLIYVNFTNTSSDPYYAFTTTNVFNATEGAWALVWSLSSGNCSRPTSAGSNKASSITYYNRVSYLDFTTKNGAQQPDLVTATDADSDTCANTTERYFTFNVTGTLDTPNPSKYDGRETCAVIAPPFQTGPTTAKSCAPTIDASAASSISAAITSKACKSVDPVVSCPPDATSDAAAGKAKQFLVGSTAWLKTAALGGLVYSLVL
ncbi:hypothetical protein F4781DRAFT_396505 [Annulohypoxylon bovei var. microspora]|nr:hypothetical protein F4781DRAFT_396505 [Annulohypoxylon bovei var. microspora]